MPHDHCLVVGAVAMTSTRLGKHINAVFEEVRDDVESLMRSCEYFRESPFEMVSVIVRLGLVSDGRPRFKKINPAYRDLPLSIEIDVRTLLDPNIAVVKKAVLRAILISVVDAGRRYERPHVPLLHLLDRMNAAAS